MAHPPVMSQVSPAGNAQRLCIRFLNRIRMPAGEGVAAVQADARLVETVRLGPGILARVNIFLPHSPANRAGVIAHDAVAEEGVRIFVPGKDICLGIALPKQYRASMRAVILCAASGAQTVFVVSMRLAVIFNDCAGAR